jgi:N-acetylmuramoyl-L-alanine amidase
MAKYEFLVIHCTATVEGKDLTEYDIMRMHMGCKLNSDGSIQYKGKKYKSLDHVPDEKIGSIHARNTRGRGWDRVGYSKIFFEDGRVHTFVEHNDDNWISNEEMTWGAKGYNAKSRHFVYAGGLAKEKYKHRSGKMKHVIRNTMTTAQEHELIRAVKRELHEHPEVKVIGHNQLDLKACPAFSVPLWADAVGIPKDQVDERDLKVRLKYPLF